MKPLDLSIIAPAHDEQGNIVGLVEDVRAGLARTGLRFEMILVDDASTDGTRTEIAEQVARYSWVRGRSLSHRPDGRGHGQSAAFREGILAARSPLVAFIDADRQNEPADLPEMIRLLRERRTDMVQGDRSANRRDSWIRRVASWVGRSFRRMVLGDTIRDTGCSIRVLRREIALELPLEYRGMHRFIPFYVRTMGYDVVEMPVRHRPRVLGSTKYGTFERAVQGLRDLLAVRWMRSRIRRPVASPIVAARANASVRSRSPAPRRRDRLPRTAASRRSD